MRSLIIEKKNDYFVRKNTRKNIVTGCVRHQNKCEKNIERKKKTNKSIQVINTDLIAQSYFDRNPLVQFSDVNVTCDFYEYEKKSLSE